MDDRDFSTSEAGELNNKSTLRALIIVAADAALYFGCVVMVFVVSPIFLKLLFSIGAGLMTGLLFVVGHDCAHQSFTRHRGLNRWAGRLAFLPSMHPFSTWDLSHNKTHHRFTNQRGRDYVWEPLTLGEFRAMSRVAQWRYRFYRTPFGQLFYNLIEIWWKRLFFPRRVFVGPWKKEYFIDHAIISFWFVSFVAGQAFVVRHVGTFGANTFGLGLAYALAFTLVIPFLYFHGLMSAVVYLHHTHPSVEWREASDDVEWLEAQMANTVHVIFPGPVNFIFHRIMEHTAHHLRPGIPMYNLRKAQAILEERHAGIIIHRWSIKSHLDTLCRCKLFDLSRRTWTDYSGYPTSVRESICESGARLSLTEVSAHAASEGDAKCAL